MAVRVYVPACGWLAKGSLAGCGAGWRPCECGVRALRCAALRCAALRCPGCAPRDEGTAEKQTTDNLAARRHPPSHNQWQVP
jgi:hypothetical protein